MIAMVRFGPRRAWTAYTVELVKASRQWTALVGPALVVAAVWGTLLMHGVAKDGSSDFDFLAVATPQAINLLGWLLIVVYSAGLVSSELGSGSIRLMLTRPLLRQEFIAAKLLCGMTYALGLAALAALNAWAVVLIRGDLLGVGFGGELIYTNGQMIAGYLIAAVLGLAPLFATVAYGVMISSLTRNTGAAVGAAIGIWIVVDLVKYPLGIAPYLFTTYLESPWAVFATRCQGFDEPWLPMAWQCVLASAVAWALFAGIAALVLARRNLQS